MPVTLGGVNVLLGGRYAIERRIGEGGMAEVLLARDRAAGDQPVVVKRSRAHLAHQPEFAHLFLREARLASLVHHPNVVELLATGDDDGQPYLVMEYLEGFTVRDIFLRATTDGGVPQDIAAAIVLGACRGLQAAHTALDEQGKPIGLVHRDVSPHNLFLTNAGVVKVLDFGIAKGAHDVTMTRAGHVKGKASYLSPEQLVTGATVDARADLFSLGIIAWEMLTGRRLFKRASETDTIAAIRTLRVPDPTTIRADLDPSYAAAVMQLLARNPGDRPANAGEVVASLDSTLARRAPILGQDDLARYVTHIRGIAPLDDPPSVRAQDPPMDRAARQRAFDEAWGAAMPGSDPKPAVHEEQTATVAPPVAGAWVSETGVAPPVDGSVVGTWAIAGARRKTADTSGGFASLDPDDLIDASKSEALPRGAIGEESGAAAAPPRPPPPSSRATGSPRPSPDAVDASEPVQTTLFPAPIERFLRAHPDLERLAHARPRPEVVLGVLAGALLAGILVAYVIASLLR